MNPKKAKGKSNKKQKLIRTFVKTMLITGGLFLVVAMSLAGCYNKYFKHDDGSAGSSGGIGSNKNEEKQQDIYKNVAVFGVDKDGYRTDVIFVVNFNSATNKVKVLSVPRDTKVDWSDEQKQSLKDLGKYSVNVSKINEMTAYGGIDNIRNFTINQLETMLGIKIDNYVIVNINAFNEIVDAIGGVDLEVPQNMYHRDVAGGLYINLQKGYQHLDGDKAEQFVRFRSYPNGDVDRVAAQQVFLKAFAEKVLSPSIITKIPDIIKVVFSSVKTDVGLMELPQYYQYVNNFDLNNLSFYTLAGEGRYQGGVSYFFPDPEENEQIVKEVFFDVTPAGEEETDEEVVIDQTVSIAVLNGGGVVGAAGRERDKLIEKGYAVQEVGNYTSMDVAETKIVAKDKTKALQFKAYYPNAEMIEDQTITTDIQIVIGQDAE